MAVATTVLAEAGVGPARVEAEQLAAYVLGVSRGRLALAEDFTPAQYDRFMELVARRVRREPLQHLLGSAAFRHVEVAVGPGVFVPRPETELLAGWGIEQARAVAPAGHALVLDLCSGSGAIALSVADEVPGARWWRWNGRLLRWTGCGATRQPVRRLAAGRWRCCPAT